MGCCSLLLAAGFLCIPVGGVFLLVFGICCGCFCICCGFIVVSLLAVFWAMLICVGWVVFLWVVGALCLLCCFRGFAGYDVFCWFGGCPSGLVFCLL